MERRADILLETLNEQDFCFTPCEMRLVEKALRRFKVYEDTGLEPEEVKRFQLYSAYGVKQAMLEEYMSIGKIDHLRELVQTENDGRLVVLPCKTGDTIYQLRGKRHAQGVGISPRIVSCAHVWSNGNYTLSHQGMTICTKKDLGKTWFLTRGEAEAALGRN